MKSHVYIQSSIEWPILIGHRKFQTNWKISPWGEAYFCESSGRVEVVVPKQYYDIHHRNAKIWE